MVLTVTTYQTYEHWKAVKVVGYGVSFPSQTMNEDLKGLHY